MMMLTESSRLFAVCQAAVYPLARSLPDYLTNAKVLTPNGERTGQDRPKNSTR